MKNMQQLPHSNKALIDYSSRNKPARILQTQEIGQLLPATGSYPITNKDRGEDQQSSFVNQYSVDSKMNFKYSNNVPPGINIIDEDNVQQYGAAAEQTNESNIVDDDTMVMHKQTKYVYNNPKMIQNLKEQIKGRGALLSGLIGNKSIHKIKPVGGTDLQESIITGGSMFEESKVTREMLNTEDLLDEDEMEISNEIPSETLKSGRPPKINLNVSVEEHS